MVLAVGHRRSGNVDQNPRYCLCYPSWSQLNYCFLPGKRIVIDPSGISSGEAAPTPVAYGGKPACSAGLTISRANHNSQVINGIKSLHRSHIDDTFCQCVSPILYKQPTKGKQTLGLTFSITLLIARSGVGMFKPGESLLMVST